MAVSAGGPSVVEVPVALAVPAVQALSVVRPIIGTNTYQQVHTANHPQIFLKLIAGDGNSRSFQLLEHNRNIFKFG